MKITDFTKEELDTANRVCNKMWDYWVERQNEADSDTHAEFYGKQRGKAEMACAMVEHFTHLVNVMNKQAGRS